MTPPGCYRSNLPGSSSGESAPVPSVGYTVADRVRALLTILQIPSATTDAKSPSPQPLALLMLGWLYSGRVHAFHHIENVALGLGAPTSSDVIPVGFFFENSRSSNLPCYALMEYECASRFVR